jgi:hypothetical protein
MGGGQWRYNSTLSNTLAVDRSEWSALIHQDFTPSERAVVPITRELGPQSQSGCSGENISFLSPLGIKPRFIHSPDCVKGIANTQWIFVTVIEDGLVNYNLQLIVRKDTDSAVAVHIFIISI